MKSFGLFLNIISTDRGAIEQRIDFLKSMENLGHVEVWLEHGDWTKEDSRWLKKKLNKLEVLVHAPFINFSFVSTHKQINEAAFEALKQTCDHVEILGGKVMTLHVGRKPFYLSNDQARNIAVPYLDKLIGYIDGKFDLTVENLPTNSGTTLRYPASLEELENVVKMVPQLKVTVDIGHCIQDEDPYEEFFTNYFTRISNIHVHNALKKGRAHFGFGTSGDLNLRDFLSFLKRIGYSNYFTLEILGDEAIRDSWHQLQTVVNN